MKLGADSRGLPEGGQPSDILKQIFPSDEEGYIERFVRLERSRELVNELILQAQERRDSSGLALLSELRINLRYDLADANRTYVEGGAIHGHPKRAVPTQPPSTLKRLLQGVFKWMH